MLESYEAEFEHGDPNEPDPPSILSVIGAQCRGGEIHVTNGYPVNELFSFAEEFEMTNEELVDEGVEGEKTFRFDMPYNFFRKKDFMEGLDHLNTFKQITGGKIMFAGDNPHTYENLYFRYIYDPDEKKWQDEQATLVFPSEAKRNMTHSARMELFGTMVDIVEDYLEDKDVQIDNPEKEDDDNAAIIYGTDYDRLTRAFEELLINCGLIDPEKEGGSD